MTIDIDGPTSVRLNDLRLLGDSGLVQRFNMLYANEPLQPLIYGDSIYPHIDCLTSSHRNKPNTPRQIAENHAYKSVRVSIEWNYAVTANTFNYLRNLDKLKVMHTTHVVKIYRACTLLRNINVCLYGSISSHYFNITIPLNMLEQYMQYDL